LGFGRLAAFLRSFGRGSARPAFVKAEINILLEFPELFCKLAGLELHLFDLPVDLPHLAFEPADPDQELRCIRLFPAIGDIAGLANVSGRTPVSLRDVNLVSNERILVFSTKILSTNILGAKARRRGYGNRGNGDKDQTLDIQNWQHNPQRHVREYHG
jgi:hypothetical protein